MSDKCPFCGAEAIPIDEAPGLPIFVCKTMGDRRSRDCYEAELARKDELLREAAGRLVKLVFCAKSFEYETSLNRSGWNEREGLNRQIDKTQAFLTTPEVVKVMEEKP